MASSTYRIELGSSADSAAPIEAVVHSVAEVQAYVAKALLPDSILIVTHMYRGADYGNFLIFLNSTGLAYVRLLQHRGFHATRPQTIPNGRTIQFMEDGMTFEVEENSTVSTVTAIAALNYWLETDQQFPGVCWRDE